MDNRYSQRRWPLLLSPLLLFSMAQSSYAESTNLAESANLAKAASKSEPPPYLRAFDATYKIGRGSFDLGKASRKLYQQPDGQFVYRSITDASYLFLKDYREEYCLFTANSENQLAFDEYKITIDGFRKDAAWGRQFDYDNKLLLPTGDAEKKLPLSNNSTTPLCQSLLLKKSLHDKTLAAGNAVTFNVAKESKLRQYVFKYVKDETIVVNEVSYATHHVTISRKDRESHIWFAYDHQLIPVKMVQYRDGDENYHLEIDAISYPKATK